jgi:hypothetical protein
LTLLFAVNASAEVVSAGSGTYMITDAGPVLGPTIVSLYQQAAAFCEKQHKEVATIQLNQTDPPHGWKSAELRFQCALKSSHCGLLVPEGASISTDTGDVTLKNGTVIRHEPCSDAERKREPPPP